MVLILAYIGSCVPMGIQRKDTCIFPRRNSWVTVGFHETLVMRINRKISGRKAGYNERELTNSMPLRITVFSGACFDIS